MFLHFPRENLPRECVKSDKERCLSVLAMSEKDEGDRVTKEQRTETAENGGVVAPDVITSSARGIDSSEAQDTTTRAPTKSHWVKFDDPEEADKKPEVTVRISFSEKHGNSNRIPVNALDVVTKVLC